MNRSTRLEKIAQINLGFENIAGASLANVQDQYRAEENQLIQLKLYREEYQRKLHLRMKAAISANEMQDYQYFFSSLDQAISQQTEKLKQIALQVESSRSNWLARKREVNKVSRAAESLRSIEYSVQLKTEQKESDELGCRLHASGKNPLRSH